MLLKRVVLFLALAFGLAGVVACAAGTYVVWLLGSRFERANDRVFAVLDTGLASARERVRGVHTQLQGTKLTANQIVDDVRDWATLTAEKRFASRIEFEHQTAKVVGRLQTAGVWLETSTESIREIWRLSEAAKSIGIPADTAALEQVVASLTSLRDRVLTAEQNVDEVREFLAGKEGELDRDRIARLVTLLTGAIAMIGEIDARLEEVVSRLSEAQAAAEKLRVNTGRCIVLMTGGCYLLVAWIAAGQLALSVCGWRGRRRDRTEDAVAASSGPKPEA